MRYILESQTALAKLVQLNSTMIPSDFKQIYEENEKDHKLKIFLHTSSEGEEKTTTVSKVMAEWYVPVTPEQFIGFMNNIDEQLKAGDDVVEVIKPVLVMNETSDQVYILYYVSHKRDKGGNARDFLYMRHSAKVDTNSYADCFVSVEHKDYLITPNCHRCEYKIGGHTIKLVNSKGVEGRPVSHVRMYLELDFKTKMPAELAKSYFQAALVGYIEKSVERLRILHPSEDLL